MRLSRLLPRFLFSAIAAGALVAGTFGVRDQILAVVQDLLPNFPTTAPGASTTSTPEKGSGGKGVILEPSGTYWPGLPSSRNEKLQQLTRIGYSLGYSTKVYSPLWVAYAIKSVEKPVSIKRPGSFESDPDIPVRHQVDSGEYTRSGYDRGHMAPNWAISVSYGREAQIESFYTTNITPQEPELNQGIWQTLESIEANDYARRYNGVVSYTGPIYSPESTTGIGKGKRIRIPNGFYKIIVRRHEGNVAVLAFIMPQSARGNGKSLPRFLASVDDVENMTGLDFLTSFPEEQQAHLEGKAAERMW